MRAPARRRSQHAPSRPGGYRRIVLAAVFLPLAAGGVTPAQAAGKSQADLRVTVTAPPSAFTGDQFDYRVTVANDGPADATSVVVEDALPSHVTLLSVNPTTACTGTTSVRCELGALPAGTSGTVVLTVRADKAGDATNHATATARQRDPAFDDNAASTTTTITERAGPDPGQTAPDSCRVSLPGGPTSCTFTYTGGTALFVALAVPVGLSRDYVSVFASHGGSGVAGCSLSKHWFGPFSGGACLDERTNTGIRAGGGELPEVDVDERSQLGCVTTGPPGCAFIMAPLPAPGTTLTCNLWFPADFSHTAEGVCRG